MAIVIVNEIHRDDASVQNPAFTIAVNIGDAVVVICEEFLSTVTSVTDDGTAGGNTYTQLVSNAPGKQTEIWGCIATKAATTVTVNMAIAVVVTNIYIATATGVASFGGIGTSQASASSNVAVSATLSNVSNLLIAGFGAQGDQGALTIGNGSFRLQDYANSQSANFATVVTNTGSTGVVQCSYTATNAVDWQSAAVELVASGVADTLMGQVLT